MWTWLAVAARVGCVGAERVLLKALGDRRPPDEAAFLFFALAVGWLLPFAPLPASPSGWGFLRLAIPNGVIYAFAFALYTSALTGGEVSQVAPLSATTAIWVMLLAFLLHGEPLGAAKLLGTGLIVFGAAALQGGHMRGLWRSRPARQMLAYALLLGATRAFDKAAAHAAPPGLYAAAICLTIALVLGARLALRGGMRAALLLARRRPWIALGASACNAFSYLLLVVTLRRLPLSVVEPLTALSLLVSAGCAWVAWREPVRTRLGPTLAIILGAALVAGTSPPTAVPTDAPIVAFTDL